VTLDNSSKPKFIVWVWVPSTVIIPGTTPQTSRIPLVGTRAWFEEDEERCVGKSVDEALKAGRKLTADEINQEFYETHKLSLEKKIDGKKQKTPEELAEEVHLGETNVQVINGKVYRTCHLATMEINVPAWFLPNTVRGAPDRKSRSRFLCDLELSILNT